MQITYASYHSWFNHIRVTALDDEASEIDFTCPVTDDMANRLLDLGAFFFALSTSPWPATPIKNEDGKTIGFSIKPIIDRGYATITVTFEPSFNLTITDNTGDKEEGLGCLSLALFWLHDSALHKAAKERTVELSA